MFSHRRIVIRGVVPIISKLLNPYTYFTKRHRGGTHVRVWDSDLDIIRTLEFGDTRVEIRPKWRYTPSTLSPNVWPPLYPLGTRYSSLDPHPTLNLSLPLLNLWLKFTPLSFRSSQYSFETPGSFGWNPTITGHLSDLFHSQSLDTDIWYPWLRHLVPEITPP